ncbi:MAG TPA: hypothetical protein PLZ74_09180 [Kiritimatiellia bacterium]|jgi:cell shape-determining protein MreD|nr:hypothetical protein [Kiritimatiellia bacterium]HOR98534.1 hypothetical protein [Kiritimatiellia bacterium]HPC48579.1 hypothetical protein [Kiritimatiellia bacterium]
MRLDTDLFRIFFALGVAALLQEMFPVIPLVPAKPGFLTAVALYYALTRPWPVALTALTWAGALTDLQDGLPLFCTIGFLLVAYGAVRLMQRLFLTATVAHGAVLVAGMAAAQTLWTRLCVGVGGWSLLWQTLAAAGYAAHAGLVAGGLGFGFCGLLDRVSGSERPVKEDNGIGWTETDQ